MIARAVTIDQFKVARDGSARIPQRSAREAMIGIFDDYGIRFEYPLDWELDIGDDGEGRTTIGVQSSDGLAFAFIRVQRRPTRTGRASRRSARSDAHRIPDARFDPRAQTIDGHESVGYDVDFFSLNVPNSCMIRSFRTPRRTVLVFAQWSELLAEDAGDVFRIVCRSLEETDS